YSLKTYKGFPHGMPKRRQKQLMPPSYSATAGHISADDWDAQMLFFLKQLLGGLSPCFHLLVVQQRQNSRRERSQKGAPRPIRTMSRFRFSSPTSSRYVGRSDHAGVRL